MGGNLVAKLIRYSVNEIFNPSRVDSTFYRPSELREASLAQDRNTNYGVVRLNLIEHIYATLYAQRIKYGNTSAAQEQWPHRVLPYRSIVQVEDSPVISGGVRMHIRDRSPIYLAGTPNSSEKDEILDVDIVFVATGYKRDLHDTLLGDARTLQIGGAEADSKWQVGRDYRVQFDKQRVSEDAGVWLQGCCEKTHGVSSPPRAIPGRDDGQVRS